MISKQQSLAYQFKQVFERLRTREGINHVYSRILQEAAFHAGGAFGKPVGIILLLTNRCNARCLHCHCWKSSTPPGSEMSRTEWLEAITKLREWLGPIFVSITGGETLLREDSIEIAQYAAQQDFWVEFLSNGSLLTPDTAKRLVGSGVKRIKISLDGSTPEIHDQIRGRKGFFHKATETLHMLAVERDTQNKDVMVWGKTTITDPNLQDLPNIVTLAHQLKIDGVEFQALEPTYYSEELKDPSWYTRNPLWIRNLDSVSQIMQRLRKLKSQGAPILNTIENLYMIEAYFYSPRQHAFKVQSHEYGKKKPDCTSWIGGLQIMPDGGMKMCHWMNPFGYVQDGNLRQVWRKREQCWKRPCPHLSGHTA